MNIKPVVASALLAVHLSLVCVLSAFCFSTDSSAEELSWLRTLDEGQQAAQDQGKNLLLLFTGQGWCTHCIILDQQVISQADFGKAVHDTYICVELDFTFGDSEQEQQRKKLLKSTAERFCVTGYPTLVLADSHLRPYARFVGYDEAAGLKRYLGRIAKAERDYRNFNALSTSFEDVPTTQQLKKLASAMLEMSAHFDVKSSQQDPLVVFYADEIERIASGLPDTDADRKHLVELRSKHLFAIQREATWQPIGDRLSQFYGKEEWEPAITFVEQQLKKVEDPLLQIRLRNNYFHCLTQSDQFELALAQLEKLLKSSDLSFEQRRRLKNQQSRCLLQLGKVDQAIALFDQRIAAAEAAGNQEHKSWLLSWKVQLMLSTGRVDETIATCLASREAAERASNDWQTATFILAMKLRSSGRFEESLQYFTELHEIEAHLNSTLNLAETNFDLQRNSTAEQWLAKAEDEIQRLRKSPRVGERQDAEEAAKRIAVLKERFLDQR